MRLTVDLPAEFALNQPLSPFALATLEVLDPDAPTYALDVVSVIEATLEDPRQVVSAQRNFARGEAVAQMKADGLDYEQRMEALESVTHPQPLAELLEATLAVYRRGHPWVDDYEVSPKSVVRDMYERAMSFGEYVRFYGLGRREGSVLRYLADAYQALRRSVPEAARSEDLTDLVEWLGETVRQTDSSLLEEWAALVDPDAHRGGITRGRAPPRRVPSGRRAAAGHVEQARVPGPGPQRHVPAGRARGPWPVGRSGRAGRGVWLGRRSVGRRHGRLRHRS